jgi:hypothetical protein
MLGLSWNTNDLNIPLGIKFVGTDSYGNNIIKWGGPFSSANLSAEVKIPGCAAPYVVYHTGFITVYPFDTDRSGSTDGNINTPFGQNFYEIAFPPLVVVNPTLNVRLTVANLDGVSKYLEIAELWINNEQKENIVTDYSNVYAKGWSTYTSVFNADEPGWGALKALDGDLTTFFKGGANSGSIDTDCQFELTLSSKTSVITSTTLISSIEIYPGPSYFGEGLIDMYLIISNYNEDGVDDELFKSTILINASTFIIGFS